MIGSLFLLGATLAFVSGAPNRQCLVGEWEEWGACLPSKSCDNPRLQAQSWNMEPAEVDADNFKMEYMMKHKNAEWEEAARCVAAGTCPEQNYLKSSGPAPCVGGTADNYPCLNINQQSFVNFDDMGYVVPAPGERTKRSNDIWGWTDPENGDEYAIVGLTGGTSFVRVTDPQNPVPVGFIYTHTSASIWRDMKVINDWVHIVSEAASHGMQSFDLTRLRGLDSMTFFEPDVHYNRFGQAHNIISNEETGFVYVVGSRRGSYPDICSGGLHVVDVNDPRNPRFAGCFGDDGYVHDAQCVNYHGPDIRYYGREICLCFNENSFTIVDVDDKSDMHVIAKQGYAGYAYTHQGWFTEDHTVCLLDDELDEQRSADKRTRTFIWDVTDMEYPVLKRVYYSTQTSIDHNQYTLGDLTYQSNYEAGLRILRVDQDNYDLTELAYFDMFPSRTTANFNGAWSVYPYFKSGNIVVSSINYGLFVLRPDYDAIQNASGYSEEKRTRQLKHREQGATCPPLVETRKCTTYIDC